MIIYPIQEMPIVPPLGALLGTAPSAEIVNEVNRRYGLADTGVLCSQGNDPFITRYRYLTETVSKQLESARGICEQVMNNVASPVNFFVPQTIDDLRYINTTMQEVVLMHPVVNQLFMNHQLYGYGYDPEDWKDHEDVYGRLAFNGYMDTLASRAKNKEENMIHFEWWTTDPKLTDDDRRAIRQTRDFLDDWMADQLKPGGDRLDPTDPENTIGLPMK